MDADVTHLMVFDPLLGRKWAELTLIPALLNAMCRAKGADCPFDEAMISPRDVSLHKQAVSTGESRGRPPRLR
jgi:hypothetical protein